MSTNILDIFKLDARVQSFEKAIRKDAYELFLEGTTANHNYLFAYLSFVSENKSVVYVASSVYKATIAYEELCRLAGFESVHFYVTDEIVSTELLAVSNEFRYERMYATYSAIKQQKKIIVTHVAALTRPLMERKHLLTHTLLLRVGDSIDVAKTVEKLVSSGYKKTPITQNVGEFSVRGGIIDIFPINLDQPYRIDLFDNEIDFIKSFDPETQKTSTKVGELEIFPVHELVYSHPEEIVDAIKKDCGESVPASISMDLEDFINYNNIERLHKYIPYVTNRYVGFLDYLEEKIVFYEEASHIEESYEKLIYELSEYQNDHDYLKHLNLLYFMDVEAIYHHSPQKVYCSEFKQELKGKTPTDHLVIHGYRVVDYQNDVKNFITDMKVIKKSVFITAMSSEQAGLIQEILKDAEVEVSIESKAQIKKEAIQVMVVHNGISFGFLDSFEVIHEAQIFKKMKMKQTKYRSAYQQAKPIYSKEDIKPNEYVVHYDYGIAKYLGMKTVELGEIKNDYLTLQFENMELYIPVENINLLEKYQGSEGVVPKLTNIGNNEWDKKKKKVREKLESIAKELLEMQAVREQRQGFKYNPDEEIQSQFESDFEFVETADQLRTINEIKKDMEEGLIVDRLVCGDVGYGKTEVAMRIALKTVLNGKQVAYLAPTTILSRQHYQSFVGRFERFGVKVELLNRFVSPKKEDEIIKGLQKGEIDIVVGTHKLLNSRVQYKDLGLLVVDEEQRFGVTHKEKIKELKHNINVLTLTATPIPRTLQMAVVGVRQLSLIETPPQNRYPVQTYVLEENDTIVREAIYRELGRKGQVFYLHNRVSDLNRVLRKLMRLVPEARILVAHGQMDKNDLEDAIQSFIDKEYDVLLCTTIIETGIDIPNTNTLIVDMADRLGLAQMYQIRGRVGRSDRVSYAYFMFEEDRVLTDTSAKRLQAMKEFTTLGSGYKIAVRDLAIRGAGDILGREQSGFIDSIGLDMYMKMLAEAIAHVSGQEENKEDNKAWNVEVSKHVSDTYVSDEDIKIYIHKQIAAIQTREDKEKTLLELTDRFGKISDEMKVYIDKKYMDGLLNQIGVEEMKEKTGMIQIVFSEATSQSIDGSKLFQRAYEVQKDINFEYRSRKIIMNIPLHGKDKFWIQKVILILESFCI